MKWVSSEGFFFNYDSFQNFLKHNFIFEFMSDKNGPKHNAYFCNKSFDSCDT